MTQEAVVTRTQTQTEAAAAGMIAPDCRVTQPANLGAGRKRGGRVTRPDPPRGGGLRTAVPAVIL